jgi:hypothetical protein
VTPSNFGAFRAAPFRLQHVDQSLFLFCIEKLVTRGLGEIDNYKPVEYGHGAGNDALDDENPFPTIPLRVVGNLCKSVGEDVRKRGDE